MFKESSLINEPIPFKGVDGQYHFIYLTENLVNGMLYYGKRSTPSLNYWYVGSGTDLWKAIKKYGKENFKRTIISFHTSKDANAVAEKLIVTYDIVESEQYYNLVLGGYGGDYRNFYKNQTPLENSLKAAKTLKSRPDILAERNAKIGARALEKLAIDPSYFDDKVKKMNALMRGATKKTSAAIQTQVENRRKNHLLKMNNLLNEIRKLDHLSVNEICSLLKISQSSVYRCREKNKLNLRWEDPIPKHAHGLLGTTADKAPWRTLAAQKTAAKIKGVYVGEKSARSKLTDIQRKELRDMALNGSSRNEIHAKFIHLVTKCTINKQIRMALEFKE